MKPHDLELQGNDYFERSGSQKEDIIKTFKKSARKIKYDAMEI